MPVNESTKVFTYTFITQHETTVKAKTKKEAEKKLQELFSNSPPTAASLLYTSNPLTDEAMEEFA